MDAEEHFPSAGPEHERDEYSDEEAEAGAVPVSSHRHSGGSPPRHGSPKHHAKATPGEASLELLFRSGQVRPLGRAQAVAAHWEALVAVLGKPMAHRGMRHDGAHPHALCSASTHSLFSPSRQQQ